MRSEPDSASTNRKAFGTLGEIDAVEFLESRGYRMIDANVRPIGGRRRGELDIVAWHGDCLAFVEVKTRRAKGSMTVVPAEAVDRRKRVQLIALANAYLMRHNLDGISCRFDVVEVVRGAQSTHLNLIENAFDANDI